MKYCVKCGAEMVDDAVLCVKCGCMVDGATNVTPQSVEQAPAYQPSSLATAAKIFMILGTIVMAITTYCIALAWCLPLTIIYCKKIKRGEPIGVGFKVCSLLFVSMVGGILMLCDKQ